MAEVSFGSGALAVIGGTIGVMVGMTAFTGTVVGLQGYSALNQVGTSALAGFISAYFNTREIAPLVAGIALSATVGCGFTAQLGAMRISEEIDALEVMGVPSIPYLVTTRIIAGFLAIIPLYAIGLLTSYIASRQVTVWFFGQSAGTYDHYFHLFLPPIDVLYSFGKVLVFSRGRRAGALLLRLPRDRRARGRGCRGRTVGAHVDRRDQRDRPVPQPRDLGRHDDGAGGGIATAASTDVVRRGRRVWCSSW